MYLRRCVCLGLMLAVGMVSLLMSPLVGRSKARAESKYEWSRVKRVTIYNSPRRARYPSITRARDGSLLVLFSRQTAAQENAGGCELVLVRSTDEGESWSEDTVVFQRRASEPRAVETN